jgi:cell division septal protein FtsQ
MEIHTNKARSEQDVEIAPQESDQSRYLRRKATQRLRKSHFASRRLLGALRLAVRVAAYGIGMAFLISICMYAYNSEKFALRNMTICGCRHQDAKQLEAIIRETCPANLLRIDLKQLRSLLESQAWVKRVEIRRVLPSDLVVYVEERVPSVILEMRGELRLTDDDGVLLDRYDTRYGNLDVPVFKGMRGDNPEGYRLYQEENAARIRLGLKLLSDLEAGSPDYPKYISEIDLSDKTNVRLTLVDDTAEIFLGDRDFLKRFRALMSNMAVYQELKSQYNEITVIDLRFDGNIIYRPRQAAGGHSVPVSG